MTILVVDNHISRLQKFTKSLQSVFSKDIVESTADPLMAGKFSFNNRVDVLFAELDLKPMNGFKLGTFIRTSNLDVKIFLISNSEMFNKAELSLRNGVDGLIIHPVTEEALNEIKVSLKKQYAM